MVLIRVFYDGVSGVPVDEDMSLKLQARVKSCLIN